MVVESLEASDRYIRSLSVAKFTDSNLFAKY